MPISPVVNHNLVLPPGRQRATVEQLEAWFVTPFVPADTPVDLDDMGRDPATRRRYLFWGWRIWIREMNRILGSPPVMVWVGGSFVTDKQAPDDIDAAVWVDGAAFIALPKGVRRKFIDEAEGNRHGCHGSLKAIVRRGADGYAEYLRARKTWDATFSNVPGASYQKGYLEILGHHLLPRR